MPPGRPTSPAGSVRRGRTRGPLVVLVGGGMALLLASGSASAQGDQGWPMVGGDPAHAGVAPGPEPPYRVAWEVEVPGGVVDAPVVAEGMVVVLGRDRVVAAEAASGDLAWEAERSRGPAGSPVVSGGTLVHASGTETHSAVIARSLEDGRELWRTPTGAPVRAALVADGDHVFAATLDGTVLALDLRKGEEAWRREVGGTVAAAPALSGGVLVVAAESSDSTVVMGLDAESGKEEWRFTSLVGGSGATPPSVGGEVVYVGAADARIHALGLTGGDERWSTRAESALVLAAPAFSSVQVAALGPDPVVADIAHVQRLDAESGEEVWSFRILDGLRSSGVTVVAGYALVGDLAGGLSAIDLGSGLLVWERDLGTGPAFSAAADGQRVYVALTGRPASATAETGGQAERSRAGRLVALQNDPAGRLTSTASESTLFPGRALLAFAGAALAVAAVILVLFRYALRRPGRSEGES